MYMIIAVLLLTKRITSTGIRVNVSAKDHVSQEKMYFPLYWLFNSDPYNGLLQSLQNWVISIIPQICIYIYIYTLSHQVFSLLMRDKLLIDKQLPWF